MLPVTRLYNYVINHLVVQLLFAFFSQVIQLIVGLYKPLVIIQMFISPIL